MFGSRDVTLTGMQAALQSGDGSNTRERDNEKENRTLGNALNTSGM
jgi:hypothetical protein